MGKTRDEAEWRDRLAALVARDGLCGALGVELIAGGPGWAEIAMRIEARHLNFHGGCHGGAIFALADTAFGLAANSHGPVAVGIDAHIAYQTGAEAGDRLVARATESSRGGRLGVYRVDVVRADPDGREAPVSTFTGTVYTKRGAGAAR